MNGHARSNLSIRLTKSFRKRTFTGYGLGSAISRSQEELATFPPSTICQFGSELLQLLGFQMRRFAYIGDRLNSVGHQRLVPSGCGILPRPHISR